MPDAEKTGRLAKRFNLITLVCGLVGAALLIVGGIALGQPLFWAFGCVVMIWSPVIYRYWRSRITPPE